MKHYAPLHALCVTILAVFILFSATAAQAEPLTKDTTKAFVQSMPAVKTLAHKMEAEGKSLGIANFARPATGQGYAPYTNAVTALHVKNPDAYQRLGSLVQKHGFSSPAAWAETGDQVIMAYISLKMEESGHNVETMKNQMAALPPETLAMVPEAERKKIEESLVIMNTVSNAPEEHKNLVSPHMQDIAEWTNTK